MNIESITIRNFKSIKDEIVIEPKEKFNILLGLNGSGKSNILQALESLNNWAPSYEYSDYVNDELSDEKPNIFIKMTISDYSLKNNTERVKEILKKSADGGFLQLMSFTDLEFNSLKAELVESIIDVLKSGTKISFVFNKNHENSYLCRHIIIYNKKILETLNKYKNFLNNKGIKDDKIWISGDEDCFIVNFPLENNFESLINIKFWKYESKYLTNDVFLKDFVSDPKEKSIALKNCLEFCGKDPYEITDLVKNSKGISSLHEVMNTKINDFLKKTWSDFFKKKRLYFLPSKDRLSFAVKNLNNTVHLNADEQSDGYKQFLSILFSVGLDKNLSNTLLLIDEPEIHLHPSSILQLKTMLKTLLKKKMF